MSASGEMLGVDVGGSKMLLGVVDPAMEVTYEERAATAGLGSEQLLDALERELGSALEARPGVEAIGIGLPCTIDRAEGRALGAVNLDLEEVPIRDELSTRLGLPVSIDNDGTAAAVGEWRRGAALGRDYVVMVTVGTGIGGGLILGGQVYRGRNGSGAELGHTVIEADGPPCQGNCPGRGCAESLASGTALGREGDAAAEREPDSALGRLLAAGTPIDGAAVTRAAGDGDRVAGEVVALIGHRLGVALASFANIFEPDVIVVGGGVAAAGETLLDPARFQVRERALPPMSETPVVPARLGNRAGMIGAAELARIEMGGSA